MTGKLYRCPICKKMVKPDHFRCVTSSMGGKAGTGKAKARDPQKMSAAGKLGAERRRANAEAKKKAKL